MHWRFFLLSGAVLLAFATSRMHAAELSPAERGYRYLTEKSYLIPDFDQETFDDVWR